ncbi:MAG: hypothetical protein HQK63_08065 [Desulfamplus sp.]|nr:hypothetical protein [Desulfamplus sp.]
MEKDKQITDNSRTYIFDKPQNVKIVLTFFFSLLVILFVADFFIHKHGHFPWEDWHSFYAVFGFVACVMVIFIAKLLRLFTKRDERYYD